MVWVGPPWSESGPEQRIVEGYACDANIVVVAATLLGRILQIVVAARTSIGAAHGIPGVAGRVAGNDGVHQTQTTAADDGRGA